jgi:hypothetical protein
MLVLQPLLRFSALKGFWRKALRWDDCAITK